ncbi:hypothetical protein BJX66DRAFT_319484 [Aspergillus keveii]|uniref:Uncharacterized protein n=1 Tax=Aspergillus keveii TaxID=714993 RepID=A0ABR4FI60_9EURO
MQAIAISDPSAFILLKEGLSLACYYRNACLFHAPGPGFDFPGMAGCRPIGSALTLGIISRR